LVDVDTARIVEQYPAPEARYLDGVAVHSNSDVYVSDLDTNAIWRLTSDGDWRPWLHSDRLNHPDGILAEEHRLVTVSFGRGGHWQVPG
jgi:streptogramin lyase